MLGVTNAITLKASTTPTNVAARIREAFTRHAQREAKRIEVIVNGSQVTLAARSIDDSQVLFTLRNAVRAQLGALILVNYLPGC